jgi:hypothetical protein
LLTEKKVYRIPASMLNQFERDCAWAVDLYERSRTATCDTGQDTVRVSIDVEFSNQ